MFNIMEYKGISGYVEYVSYSNEFHVRTLALTKNIFVMGKSADELKSNFEQECDKYLALCEENNTPIFKTTFGAIHCININPKLHEMALIECKLKDITMDELIEKSFNKYFNLTF